MTNQNVLGNTEKQATYAHITPYRQYTIFDVSVDLYPNDIGVEDVLKKSFLHVIHWLKKRIGQDEIQKTQELQWLKDYPEPEDFKDFSLDMIYNFRNLEVIDVRTFFMKEEKSWALKITEPDNLTHLKNRDAKVSEVGGRYYITDIALRESENCVTLSVETRCKEPSGNTDRATSFRPSFIKRIFWDDNISMTEAGLSRDFAYEIFYDNTSRKRARPILVADETMANRVRKELLENPNRQLPVLLCPEKVLDLKLDMRHHRGEMLIYLDEIYRVVIDTMAYATVVVVKDECLDALFPQNDGDRLEYYDLLEDDYFIYHSKFNAKTGLPEYPFYCSLENNKEDITDREFLDISAFETMVTYAHRYPVGRIGFQHAALFYRELKKHFYAQSDPNVITQVEFESMQHELADWKEKCESADSLAREREKQLKDLQGLIDEKLKKDTLEKEARKEAEDQFRKELLSYTAKIHELEHQLGIY